MIKARGNFDRMADRCARRDGQAPPGELLAMLRHNERNPWKPPGGGLAAALTHDVIHGQDITVSLALSIWSRKNACGSSCKRSPPRRASSTSGWT